MSRRKTKWIVLSCFAVGVGPIAWTYLNDKAYEGDLARIQSFGVPITLDAAQPKAPPSKLLEDAANERDAFTGTDEVVADYVAGGPRAWEAKHLWRLRSLAYSLAGQKAISMPLVTAAEYDKEAKVRHYLTLKSMFRLLCGEALEKTAKGDASGAIEAIEAANNLSVLLSRNETLLAGLVATMGQGFIWKADQQYLQRFKSDPNFLALFTKHLASRKELAPLHSWLKSEVAVQLAYVDIATIHINYGDSFNDKMRRWFAQSSTNRTSTRRALAAYWRAALENFPGDGNELAWRQSMGSIDKRIDAEPGPQNDLFREVNQGMDEYVRIYLRSTARRRVILAATDALLRYKVDKQLPDSLGSIQDPFDGKPVKYLKTPSGFKVYSIGDNWIDDRGAHRGLSGPDIVFECTLP